MGTGEKALGKFVWHDLMTTDVAKAIAFYTDLVGWTINEFDMGPMGKYKMIHAAGEDHGGFNQLPDGAGMPSHWICYVTVDDVDAATAKAVELGGKAPEPGMDIPEVGRMGVIMDPQGASISPYKPLAWGGEGYEGPGRPGTFVWHELMTPDAEAAGEFYSQIFGWKVTSMEGPFGKYYVLKRPDRPDKDAGGILPKPGGVDQSSMWLPYIGVEDVDAAAARVEPLGGKVWVQPKDIPTVGRFAVASDPTGALFALFK